MSPPHSPRWRMPTLLAFLFLGTTGLAYYGIRDGAAVPPSTAPAVADAVGPADLPRQEPPAPPGPHRDQFQTACTVCHSTRLVLTQPRFTEKQWAGVVDKMTNVYGAPISADQKPELVAYLMAVRGR